MDEVFNTGTKITSSSPNILNKSDLAWVDLQLLSQPTIIELNTLILKKYELIGLVEHLNADHNKPWEMPSSKSDIVKIVEPEAELWTD